MYYLTILLSFFMVSTSHVGHVATYYYQLDGNILHLKFVVEKAVILHFEINDECDMKLMTAQCTADYLERNSTMRVNDQALNWALDGSSVQKGNLVLLLSTELGSSEISTLQLENRCFYEFDPEFKNRIVLDVGKFQQSYLLSKSTNSIVLE